MSLLPSATFSAPGVPLYGGGGGGGGGANPEFSTITVNGTGSIFIDNTTITPANSSNIQIVNGDMSKTLGTGSGGNVLEVLTAVSSLNAATKIQLVDGASSEAYSLTTTVSAGSNVVSMFATDSTGTFAPLGGIVFTSSINNSVGGMYITDDSQAYKNYIEVGDSNVKFVTESKTVINNDGTVPAFQTLALGAGPFGIEGGSVTAPLWNFSTISGKTYQLNLNIQSLSNSDSVGVSVLGVKGASSETYFGKWDNSVIATSAVFGSPTCFFTADGANATVFGVNGSSTASTILTTTTSFGILRLD